MFSLGGGGMRDKLLEVIQNIEDETLLEKIYWFIMRHIKNR